MENNKIDFVTALKIRTKNFVLCSIKLFQSLPKTEEARVLVGNIGRVRNNNKRYK